MNKPLRIAGTEHWTTKDGGVKLFLWNKNAGDPSGPAGRILFVHGSSMASQPTFDLQVPGRADSSVMDYFAARGYDTWCVDMEGYGRSTKNRDNNAPIAYGADDCFAAASYIEKLRGKRPLLIYGISSGALRAALFAQRHPERAKDLPRSPREASDCPSFAPAIDARSIASSCARSSSATIPAPPTTR
jgi:pimeloyl-ACP methyl ester carboxylesterase